MAMAIAKDTLVILVSTFSRFVIPRQLLPLG